MSLKNEVQEKTNDAAQLKDENEALRLRIDEMKNEVLKVEEELQKLGEEILQLKTSQTENLQKLQEAETRNSELQKESDTLSETLKKNEELSAENIHLKHIIETMYKLQAKEVDEPKDKQEDQEEKTQEKQGDRKEKKQEDEKEEKQGDQKEKAEVPQVENASPADAAAEGDGQMTDVIYDMLGNDENQAKEEDEEDGETNGDNESPVGEEEEGADTGNQEERLEIADPAEGSHTAAADTIEPKLTESNSFASPAADMDSSTPL